MPLPSARLPRAARAGQGALGAGLSLARRQEIDRHLRLHRALLDTDARGAPVLRSEVVTIDPRPEALERIRGIGFTVIGDRMLDGLDLRIVVLRSPEGIGTRAALRRLRQLDPAGSYDYNHLYFPSGADSTGARAAAAAPAAASRMSGAVRVGLIDSGVAAGHAAFLGVEVKPWGCEGSSIPHAHGTAVASLLVGDADGNVASGSVLYAADIHCGRPTGGSVTAFAEAMAWLARERVGVINLSLVGPHNQLLQRATQALAARGHVLVAAVGNDGPAAAPLYPAAYPEVIGVTAVDGRHRALPEAGRGEQVDFAARGSELRAAQIEGGWGVVRGTSFSAPLVARAAARIASMPGTVQLARVRAQLVLEADDLGAKGRDSTYGYGLLGAQAPAVSVGAR